MLLLLAAGTVLTQADLHATVYGNTALAPDGTEHVGSFDGTSLTGLQLRPYSSVLIQGQLTPATAPDVEYALFSVSTDAGYIRLWVDDHLLVDGGPGSPAAVSSEPSMN